MNGQIVGQFAVELYVSPDLSHHITAKGEPNGIQVVKTDLRPWLPPLRSKAELETTEWALCALNLQWILVIF